MGTLVNKTNSTAYTGGSSFTISIPSTTPGNSLIVAGLLVAGSEPGAAVTVTGVQTSEGDIMSKDAVAEGTSMSSAYEQAFAFSCTPLHSVDSVILAIDDTDMGVGTRSATITVYEVSAVSGVDGTPQTIYTDSGATTETLSQSPTNASGDFCVAVIGYYSEAIASGPGSPWTADAGSAPPLTYHQITSAPTTIQSNYTYASSGEDIWAIQVCYAWGSSGGGGGNMLNPPWTLARSGTPSTKTNVQGVIQGSGGPIAFTDDSANWIVATQEGITGVAKIPIAGIASVVLGGYSINADIYNNIRSISQKAGVIAASCSTGAESFQSINATTMATNWIVGQGGASHAVVTDGTWLFGTVDSTPGVLKVVNATNSAQSFSVTANGNDDWSSGAYWMYLDTANKRLAIGVNNTKVYLYDYSPLYGGTPAAPTYLSQVAENFGFPVGNRLYCITGLVVHTYNISTPTSPTLIGGSSTYTSSNAQTYGLICHDSVNNLLYLPWGRTGGVGATDVLAINTGTDALTLKTTIPAWTIGGVVISPLFAALSPDGTKYSTSTEYPQGDGTIAGGAVLYDVTNIHSGGSATQLSIFPCQAEPRGVWMSNSDTAAFMYTASRYDFQVSGANDALTGVQWILPSAGTPSQVRNIGVTSGSDPDGKVGPCTSDNYFIAPGANEPSNNDLICHAYGGTVTPVWQQSGIFVDCYWDGKYLWAVRTNVGHNGTPDIACYTVTWTSGGGWVVTMLTNSHGNVQWTGPSFTAFPQAALILVPGTSYDANTAKVVLAVGWDPTYGGSVGTAAGTHLISFPNNAAPSELTVGIFPDVVFNNPTVAPTVTATTGGAGANTGKYARFQIVYQNAGGTVLGLSPISTAVQCTGSNTAWAVNLSAITPPTGATQWELAGQFSYDGSNWFGEIVLPGYVNEPIATTSVTYTPDIGIQSGQAPPTIGNPFPTAGDLMRLCADPLQNIVYVPWGDYGVRCYNMTSNTVTVLTQSGLPNPYNPHPLVSDVGIIQMPSGNRYLVTNNYGANPGNVGNGMLVWNITSGVASGVPVWLEGPNEGFTLTVNQKANYAILASLSGYQAWTEGNGGGGGGGGGGNSVATLTLKSGITFGSVTQDSSGSSAAITITDNASGNTVTIVVGFMDLLNLFLAQLRQALQ